MCECQVKIHGNYTCIRNSRLNKPRDVKHHETHPG